MSMKETVFNAITPYINLTLFNVSSHHELMDSIYNVNYKADNYSISRSLRTYRKIKKRSSSNKKGNGMQENPAVLYMNLGNKNKQEYDCPTSADASAVSLAQMAFLSMTVSIFTVIASITNNINNNNNNNNNNNLNFVKQKTQSISQNQNVVNQINIDLPPPVPGRKKRAYSLETRLQKRSRFVEDFFVIDGTTRSKRNLKCDTTSLAVTKALENMVKAGFNTKYTEDAAVDIATRRQCFGSEICLRMVEDRRKENLIDSDRKTKGIVKRAVHEFETLILLYHQLSDYSVEFTNFLKDIKYDDVRDNSLNCFDLFPDCH